MSFLLFPIVAHEIVELTGREVRVTVPGHFQRGGSPCPYDRFTCHLVLVLLPFV